MSAVAHPFGAVLLWRLGQVGFPLRVERPLCPASGGVLKLAPGSDQPAARVMARRPRRVEVCREPGSPCTFEARTVSSGSTPGCDGPCADVAVSISSSSWWKKGCAQPATIVMGSHQEATVWRSVTVPIPWYFRQRPSSEGPFRSFGLRKGGDLADKFGRDRAFGRWSVCPLFHVRSHGAAREGGARRRTASLVSWGQARHLGRPWWSQDLLPFWRSQL